MEETEFQDPIERKEQLLKYTWTEFLKTPFTLIFFALFVILGYVGYLTYNNARIDNDSLSKKYYECNELRVKDRQDYIDLLREIQLNQTLKKADSVKTK